MAEQIRWSRHFLLRKPIHIFLITSAVARTNGRKQGSRRTRLRGEWIFPPVENSRLKETRALLYGRLYQRIFCKQWSLVEWSGRVFLKDISFMSKYMSIKNAVTKFLYGSGPQVSLRFHFPSQFSQFHFTRTSSFVTSTYVSLVSWVKSKNI